MQGRRPKGGGWGGRLAFARAIGPTWRSALPSTAAIGAWLASWRRTDFETTRRPSANSVKKW